MIVDFITKRIALRKMAQCFFYLLSFTTVLIPIEGQAASSIQVTQQKNVIVTGTVEDSHGEPIIGANIVVENGTTGTITDIDGAFKLAVPQGAKLKISFIGYETKVVTVKGNNLKVVLNDDSNVLDEVQIVAYGAQKK